MSKNMNLLFTCEWKHTKYCTKQELKQTCDHLNIDYQQETKKNELKRKLKGYNTRKQYGSIRIDHDQCYCPRS